MTSSLTSQEVWAELGKQLFAVLGMVTAENQSRTVGVVYVARDHKLYVATGKETWKVRHVENNPHVSVTVPIAKRIPMMPWIRIPAATITFSGEAAVRELSELDEPLLQALLRGLQELPQTHESMCIIEIEPKKEFITYGVGVSLMTMRNTQMARGRVPVA